MNGSVRSAHSHEEALDSLLTAWAQSKALPPSRAMAIQTEATKGAAREDRSQVGLPSRWWFGFTYDLAGILNQASRCWGRANAVVNSPLL